MALLPKQRCSRAAVLGALYTDFPHFQFAVLDNGDWPIAASNTVPLQWDGSLTTLPAGWDDAVQRAFVAKAKPASTLCALAAVVDLKHRGVGLSTRVIEEMKGLAVHHGFHSLIAPVQPTWKARYPLSPIERYMEWRRLDGTAFGPWLRVHLRIGGVVLGPAPHSAVIEGRVSE
jgi:hypothetical protein